jgi:hypothetical protein
MDMTAECYIMAVGRRFTGAGHKLAMAHGFRHEDGQHKEGATTVLTRYSSRSGRQRRIWAIAGYFLCCSWPPWEAFGDQLALGTGLTEPSGSRGAQQVVGRA